ncbi:MAG: thioredoxin family protein [Candidatus Pacebacteria bacterium]|nr:thioredoxin family protein [Candidatus Paceibacterota bacterium]
MTEEKTTGPKKKRIMMYIFIGIFAIAVITLGIVYYQKNIAGKGKQQIVQKAFDYIVTNLSGGSKLELGEIDKNSHSFYRFIVKTKQGEVPTYVSTDGKLITFRETDISTPAETTTNNTDNTESNKTTGTTIDGNFTMVEENEICKENGKPIIYFFGSTTCPHCIWEKPIIQEVVKSFGDKISYHENIDNSEDQDIFNKFNTTGSIPTIIVGCKYYRIGSGEQDGIDKEKENLKKVIEMVLSK